MTANSPGCLYWILSLLGIESPSRESQIPKTIADAFALEPSLVTENEFRFYTQLQVVVGKRFTIFAKVRLADIFSVNPINPSLDQAHFNRISSRHVDFLICENETLRPRFAIELDDRSHRQSKRIQRDGFVNELFSGLGLPLIRIPAAMKYQPEAIRDRVLSAFR